MKRFRVLSAVLIGAVAVMLAMPGAPRAEAADAQFVLAALRTLEAHYVDPLSAPTMLNAALDSARDQSHAASFGGPIPADADAAEGGPVVTPPFREVPRQGPGEKPCTEVAH